MNKQEIFNKVRDHLLKQNMQSFNKTEGIRPICAYRGQEGRSCAIGCLIEDEDYSPELEGDSVYEDSIQKALENSLGRPITKSITRMLNSLQRLHDDELPGYWNGGLLSIAEKHGLEPEGVTS